MLAAIFGVAGFVFILFAAGGFAEGDMGKTLKWSGATLACFMVLILVGSTGAPETYAECRTDWDGRSNPEICD